ncbi:MAG: DUF1894 domain-containing protein [Methanobacteriaceae archaeon]|jgi:hypothetical protein|nr:DUF1894 domain-containing protein [Methanobacteriaceae archaeon]MDP2837602.1 DUF1894 domain-containing protein [Methanobacteriaceae archaeon]MDP3034188.1 DUF1894 domain-containing protein [Methanobacteriaceae archaeon]MDP3484658.1 DUF1894 domain-containing protein [Methanobacteriaceae archaeon]MDP3624115.1 DUF1894 domain-containing protein [Methanobacteriaceae archaeon]
MSFCLETYLQQSDDYTILAKQTGFKDCAKLIEEKAKIIVYINPGEKILGARIIGLPPIPIGVDDEKGTVMMPYTKPCYGTAVVELPVDVEEIDKIKAVAIKK